ncbi:LysR substrate-binding domain-containing protein [Serratia sp. M24T3]|uniref:LysR substrate-binding domain-containing protein n=1 Tax=Serratia sp. M24T3 TaxID=932213 RepID=UPI002100741B|nr:LysR substrate-binding domain-containing protein [Serratia sp. M24T3]
MPITAFRQAPTEKVNKILVFFTLPACLKNVLTVQFRTVGLQTPYPEVAYSSPSIEMVRCMVGQGLGFSVLVTRPCSDMTYDGQRLVQLDIVGEMAAPTLIIAYLPNNEPTRPTRLFMDYCRRVELTPTVSSH